MECIETCEALDASDPSRADAGVPSAGGSADAGASLDAGASSGGASSDCPEPPFPCERLCWELDARFGRGRPTTLTGLDATDDTDLAALGEPYIRCAQARAAECRAGGASAAPGSPESENEPDLPVRVTTSWTGYFLECAGLPLDFEMFFD